MNVEGLECRSRRSGHLGLGEVLNSFGDDHLSTSTGELGPGLIQILETVYGVDEGAL